MRAITVPRKLSPLNHLLDVIIWLARSLVWVVRWSFWTKLPSQKVLEGSIRVSMSNETVRRTRDFGGWGDKVRELNARIFQAKKTQVVLGRGRAKMMR